MNSNEFMDVDQEKFNRYISEKVKNNVLIRQEFRCANSPFNPAVGLADYKCLLWMVNNGLFDQAGFQFDHIAEYCITKDNDESNIQALCPNCHSVKTKIFRKNKSLFTSYEIQNGAGAMEL